MGSRSSSWRVGGAAVLFAFTACFEPPPPVAPSLASGPLSFAPTQQTTLLLQQLAANPALPAPLRPEWTAAATLAVSVDSAGLPSAAASRGSRQQLAWARVKARRQAVQPAFWILVLDPTGVPVYWVPAADPREIVAESIADRQTGTLTAEITQARQGSLAVHLPFVPQAHVLSYAPAVGPWRAVGNNPVWLHTFGSQPPGGGP